MGDSLLRGDDDLRSWKTDKVNPLMLYCECSYYALYISQTYDMGYDGICSGVVFPLEPEDQFHPWDYYYHPTKHKKWI